jgi:hypothetical protein
MVWLRLVGYVNYFRSFTVLKLLSTLVYYDNINVVYLPPNLVQHRILMFLYVTVHGHLHGRVIILITFRVLVQSQHLYLLSFDYDRC